MSVFVPSDESRERYPGAEPHMFVQDVRNGLMPYRSRLKGSPLRLVPPNDELELTIAEAFSISHGGNGFYQSLSEFIRLCAAEVLTEGQGIFEIVFFTDAAGQLVDFQLVHINPESVRQSKRKLTQIVPNELASRRGIPTESVLPADRLIIFQVSTALRAEIACVMGALAASAYLPSPPWVMEQWTGTAKAQVPYDFSEHQATRNRLIAHATRRIGWTMRFLINEDITEHYWFQRYLRFEAFKIKLRDEMLGGVNRALRIAGERGGFSAQIELVGLPTHADIKKARSMLMCGEGSFKDISDLFSGGEDALT